MSKTKQNCKKLGKNTSTPTVKLKKSLGKPTGTAYLQVFGSGGGDTSPSVFLFADSQRYVFSCGEGTQRLFHEHKLKLGKINNLFLTQLSWQRIGGLPGLLLTLREAGKQSLAVHGPLGLKRFITASQCFMPMYNVDLKCVEYGDKTETIYEDENILVKAISVEGENKHNFSFDSQITEICDHDECSNFESSIASKDSRLKPDCCVDTKQGHSKRLKLDVKSRTIISYICELVALPGKMNVKKALQLGVPKGPLLGKLQKGQDVTLENGSVVKAVDIVEKSAGGCVFCVIDCPSEHHLKQLENNKELVSHEDDGKKETPAIIIHLSPAHVVQTQPYQSWMDRFGDSCQHLFLNSGMCPPKVSMFSQMGIQYSLNQLDPGIFPRLFVSNTSETPSHGPNKDNWTVGEPFLIFHLRPAAQIGYSRTDISSKWNTLVEKVLKRQNCLRRTEEGVTVNEIEAALKDFMNPEKKICRKDELSKRNPETLNPSLRDEFQDMDKEMSVVFLGTGASLPSKYRNVSCTLVNISKDKVILLDCGEGSYGQLYRHYGPGLKDVLQKLCCVFISHIHADHHLGLVKILRAWERSTHSLATAEKPKPIVVIGPPSLWKWLQYYGSFCETLHLRFYNSCKFPAEEQAENTTLTSLLDSKVSIVPVKHCPRAFGLVLTHKKGWKLVYSGDTRPCHRLIEKGLHATILIHEATLEDDLHAEALSKQHSTTSEAIRCGQEMQTKFTILNHFSQRYPKIPVFSEKFNDCVGIAFDQMEVNFQNLNVLPKLLKPLQEIFKGELEEQSL